MARDYSLKKTFNTVAELYNQARPNYPEELFRFLIQNTGLTTKSKLLEIGCGTGQATEYFARNNFSVLAIDIGDNLIKIAQRNFQDNDNVELRNIAFEDLDITENSLDLIYSATAFHWVDPEIQFVKTHGILKEGGHLAIINTSHVSDEQGDEFFHATQKWYKEYQTQETYDPNFTLPKKSDLKPKDFDTELFELVSYEMFSVTEPYTSDKYINLLSTYSNHISMSDESRNGFMQSIKKTIDEDFDGTIQKYFVFTLTLLKVKK